ncbi:TonB-dependent receptor [Maridesulfovibrio sp.]|uniref:TonB-dependent receptor n=1 Tax=Maridesulfovibrio sp. TaxID=2795000 RepID=UPI003BA97F10
MKDNDQLRAPSRLKVLITSVTMALLLLAVPAIGQDKDEKTAAEKDKNEMVLAPVTVTANKQEEEVQKVPMAITVFDEMSIEDKKIDDLTELSDYVPNLMIFNDGPPGVSSPSMRGIHADAESLSVSTGLFIDGIPVSSTVGYSNNLLDIERIEVLRGPQGTLYGKNTEVGAINIITRLPGNDYRGKVSTDVGYRKKSASFNLSGPILQDELFFGFAGQFFRDDGFVEHTVSGDPVDDEQYLYGKGQLRWTPREDLELRLIASHIQYDNGAFRMGPNPEWWSAMLPTVPGDRKVSSDHEGYGRSSESNQALKVTYDFSDHLTFTSTTTHRFFNDNRAVDIDLTSVDMLWRDFDNDYRTFSEELRLNYENSGWKWLMGLYADNDSINIREIASGGPRNQDVDKYSYAVFGQATIPITTKLSAIGGLRYEVQQTDFKNRETGEKQDGSWDNIAPKLSLEYQFQPNLMGYASASKGFRSGGINYNYVDPGKIEYKSEELWSYEVGAKSRWLDDRLILNGAAYYMDIQNMQVYEGYPPMRLDISNSAKGIGYGLELEMQALITKTLSLDASFGYSNVEFDDFTEDGVSYDGNKSPFAPEYTFNVGAQYRMENGFISRMDVVGYGKMYLDKANRYSRDAYQLVNAKVGYEGETMDIYLYCKNIFDVRHDAEGYYGGMYTLYSDPREVGLNLSLRF